MRRIGTMIGLALLAGGCGWFKTGPAPAYREPNTTAVWGTWVLRTPDSTAFAGADNVQLQLSPGAFQLVAEYPSSPTVRISGAVDVSDRGVVTLTPYSSVSASVPTGRALRFNAGQPISLLASASGNTLVFSPEHRNIDPTPSSVWHKFDAAKEAGMVKKTATALRDSTKP